MDTSPVKIGERVKLTLVATTTDRASRMANGVHSDIVTGNAINDLVMGERFTLDLGFDHMRTSVVGYVGKGFFTTKNSTYTFERIEK